MSEGESAWVIESSAVQCSAVQNGKHSQRFLCIHFFKFYLHCIWSHYIYSTLLTLQRLLLTTQYLNLLRISYRTSLYLSLCTKCYFALITYLHCAILLTHKYHLLPTTLPIWRYIAYLQTSLTKKSILIRVASVRSWELRYRKANL